MRTSITLLLAGCVTVSACGDDEEKAPSGSFDAINERVSSPTGTLEATNAVSVADAYEQISSASVAGRRLEQSQSQTVEQACLVSGNYTVTASGDQNSAQATLTYNDCCMAEACCYNGTGNSYYSAGDTLSYCAEYDLTLDCMTAQGAISYVGCFDGTGLGTFLVEVEGETYAVSGTYSAGSGTLTIADSTGSFTCTYSGGTGSCSGAGEFSF
jgi:hypothetical protein